LFFFSPYAQLRGGGGNQEPDEEKKGGKQRSGRVARH